MTFSNGLKVLSAITFLVLSLSLISALSLSPSSQTITLGNNQTSFTIGNNMNDTDSVSILLTSPPGFIYNINPSTFDLNVSQSKTVSVSLTSLPSSLSFGEYGSRLTATGTSSSTNATITFVKSFCKAGSIGENLSISRIDINSDGSDDLEWRPLDQIEIKVKVENNGDDDVREVNVEIGLYDSEGRNKIGDVDFDSTDEETIDLGTINNGDDDTATFTFMMPADLDEGNYKLVAKAYSDKTGESKECTDTSSDLDNDFYQPIDVVKESDSGKFIAFDNIVLSPERATCGDSVTLSTDVWNIGDEDQDQVKVNLKNTELGLDQSFEIKNDLNQGDNQQVSFTFQMPQNARDKTYVLGLSSDYDYKNGNYREHSDDQKEVSLQVIGCAVAPTPGTTKLASIDASLDSDAIAGKEMDITIEVTNLDSKSNTFSISLIGLDWAVVESISPRTLTLDAGETGEVSLRLTIDEATSKENSFTIQAKSANKTDTREISVDVQEAKSSFSLPQLFQGNAVMWAIIIINVVLVILIIVVAVRIARRD